MSKNWPALQIAVLAVLESIRSGLGKKGLDALLSQVWDYLESRVVAKTLFTGSEKEMRIISKPGESVLKIDSLMEEMVLAIDEACQNIIRHVYPGVRDGQAELEIICKDGLLEFRLQDFGPTSDKDKIKPKRPKKLRPGGLGVFLMHEIMDEVGYLPVPPGKGNLLRLVKRIERGAK